MTRLNQLKMWFLVLLFVPAVALVGCSDDPAPVVKDSAVPDKYIYPDYGGTEGGTVGDSYVWPDTSNPGDMWQWPDLYSGTPFGCQSDADCFGRQCCATPWGVKVCADSCSP